MERIRDAEGLTFCPPVRRSDGHRRQRHRGPGAHGGPAGRRRRRGRRRWRRADQRGRRGASRAAGRRAACTASSPSARTPCRWRSSANEIVRIQPESVADGLGAPFAGEWTLAMARRYVDDIVLLDDPTILAGLRFVLERGKQLLEPAGAAALAAVLAGRIPIRDGERVAVDPVGRQRRDRPAWASCSNARRPCPERPRDGRTTGRARPAESVARSAADRSGRRATARRARPARRADTTRRTDPARKADTTRRAVVTARRTTARRTADIRPTAVGHVLVPPVESTRRLVGASFDLLARASEEMRGASFYIGAVILGTVGPVRPGQLGAARSPPFTGRWAKARPS